MSSLEERFVNLQLMLNSKDQVADRLRSAIKSRSSQKEIADALGLSESAVSQWLKRGGLRAWIRLRDICGVLGVSSDQILGLWEGEPETGVEISIPLVPDGQDVADLDLDSDSVASWVGMDALLFEPLGLRQSWPGRFVMTFARSLGGDAMGWSVSAGLILDREAQITDGEVHVIWDAVADLWVARRVWTEGATYICRGEESGSRPFTLRPGVDVGSRLSIARVIWAGQPV
jgi:transcriptional regulator with XRE-family HTH domain